MSQDQARFYRPRPVTETKRSEDLDDGQSANQRPSTRNPTRMDSSERCESRLRRRDARECAGSRRVRQSRTGDSTPSRLVLGNDLATLVACDDASAMSPAGTPARRCCLRAAPGPEQKLDRTPSLGDSAFVGPEARRWAAGVAGCAQDRQPGRGCRIASGAAAWSAPRDGCLSGGRPRRAARGAARVLHPAVPVQRMGAGGGWFRRLG